MIAGLSGREASLDIFFESMPGGMRIVDFAGESSGVGVPENDLE